MRRNRERVRPRIGTEVGVVAGTRDRVEHELERVGHFPCGSVIHRLPLLGFVTHTRAARVVVSGRRPRGWVHLVLGGHDRTRRSRLGVVARGAGRASRVGRLLGGARAGAGAHRGPGADLRQLLRPGAAHARQLRGVPTDRLVSSFPLHAPGWQVVDALLARGAGAAGARFFDCFLRGEDNGMREAAPVRLEVRTRGHECTRSATSARGLRPGCAGRRSTSRPASFAWRRRRPARARRWRSMFRTGAARASRLRCRKSSSSSGR